MRAGSRIHGYGTIFSRMTSLVNGGVIPKETKPLWFDIYKSFPPAVEPRMDRKTSDVVPKTILYPEDIVRALFYKSYISYPAVRLYEADRTKHVSQIYVDTYLNLFKEKFSQDENELMKKTEEILFSRDIFLRRKPKDIVPEDYAIKSKVKPQANYETISTPEWNA